MGLVYNIGMAIAFQEKVGIICGEVICNLKLPFMSINGTSLDRYNTTKYSNVSGSKRAVDST